jgi:DNA-binding GntR family transcriptional regulator
MAERETNAPSNGLIVKESTGLAEKTYRALREAIERGTLKPGQRIREAEISRWLSVSRTPVREGLRRLQSEGLVDHAAGLGLSVASHDLAAISELYDFREALEGTAAALAAQHANPTEISLLTTLVDAERSLPDDPVVHARHNKMFHLRLFQASHNRFVMKSLQGLHDAVMLLGPTTLMLSGRRHSAIDEHASIVVAIASRDPVAAEHAARGHIKAAYEARVQMLSEEVPAGLLQN